MPMAPTAWSARRTSPDRAARSPQPFSATLHAATYFAGSEQRSRRRIDYLQGY